MLCIILASNNAHKLKEIKEILSTYPIEVKTPKELNINAPEAIEDGKTYAENALIKAKNIAKLTSFPVIADDSGLEITAMDNKPGIYSARYAESLGGHKNAFKEIWNNIKDKEDRSAKFVCNIALCNFEKEPLIFKGEVKGQISLVDRGVSGFGYDPIFIPDGYDKSFAELSEQEKNHISHRARALENMAKYILNYSDVICDK